MDVCFLLLPYCCFMLAEKMSEKPVRKWYDWYSPEDTPAERKLILKLDLLVIPYAFILYWVKYIDQTNISKSTVASSGCALTA